jgi:DNA modification methylase
MTAKAALAIPWRNRIVGQGEEPPEQLLANPLNWRTHPKAQRAALVGSLDSVGWVQHVVKNQRTGHVVDGHARIEEAISRGAATVPVLYVDLDPEEEALVLATLDPIGAMATRDDAKLAELLAGISIDNEGLAALLGDLLPRAPKAGLTNPDSIPEIASSSVLRGGVYFLGRHRLMCGDSSAPADVAQLMGPDRAALIATDPPYGVDYAEIVAGRSNQKAGNWPTIASDQPGVGAELAGRSIEVSRSFAADGCAVFVWHPNGTGSSAFLAALVAAGVHILKQIIWLKPSLVFGRHEYHWRHESAAYGWFEGSRAAFYGDRSATTVWEVDYAPGYKVRNGPAMAQGGLGLHPTQKPVELYEIPLVNHTRPDEVLYEPFCGSGSGIIAAERLGRRCLAMEIEPHYVSVAIERWECFTGEKAERIDG